MKRRKLQAVLVILSICFPSIIFSQTADEIIAKHIAAHGGADKWEKVEAIKITGKYTAFSLEKDFTTYKTQSGAYYSDFYLGDHKLIESFNGKEGWIIDPWMEIEYARKANSGENYMLMQKAEFFTPFYKYKEKGYKVEFTGKDNVDGIDVFVLKLTRNNGKSETWYLDAETYLEYKCEADWIDFARTRPAEMYYDDFRTIDGLVIPFFTERIYSVRDRITQIEEIEINPEFDENILVMPKRKEISKLDFLKGDWDVKMEVMTRRGDWREMANTSSSIKYTSTNLLQEKMSYEHMFPNTLSISFSYNEGTEKYRIAAFNDFTSSIEILQGDFNDNTLVLEDTKISFNEEKDPARTCRQFTYTKIDDNSFTLENKVSTDEGKTWNPRAKFTYTRKSDTAVSQK